MIITGLVDENSVEHVEPLILSSSTAIYSLVPLEVLVHAHSEGSTRFLKQALLKFRLFEQKFTAR